MDSTDHSKLKLEVLLSQLNEDPFDVDRPHQKILLVLHKFYLMCKDGYPSNDLGIKQLACNLRLFTA